MNRMLNDEETFRAQELLLQRATEGLDDHEADELAALGVDQDSTFDLAASAVGIATLQLEQIPSDVTDRILIAAGVAPSRTTQLPSTLAGVVPPRSIRSSATIAAEPTAQPAPVIPLRPRRSHATTYAVIAAAACFVVAVGSVLWAAQKPPRETVVEVEVPAKPPTTPTAAEARAELLASASDVSTLLWQATKDPNAMGAGGDVVWSASVQRGYMRFTGLTPNDKTQLQYQLWIFDKSRDQAFPVDGGVFDVSSTGEVIVPISAKLHVDEPVLFAVTIEKPGGVVVSKRERIVVTAAPKA